MEEQLAPGRAASEENIQIVHGSDLIIFIDADVRFDFFLPFAAFFGKREYRSVTEESGGSWPGLWTVRISR